MSADNRYYYLFIQLSNIYSISVYSLTQLLSNTSLKPVMAIGREPGFILNYTGTVGHDREVGTCIFVALSLWSFLIL